MNFENSNKKKKQQHSYLNNKKSISEDNNYFNNNDKPYQGSRGEKIYSGKGFNKNNFYEDKDDFLQKIIDEDSGKDYFICMESNQREKISNERKDARYIPIKYFFELIKPFETNISQLYQQIESHNKINTEQFQHIINSLGHHPIAQNHHKENLVFSSKYFKRYIRIFDALNKFIETCDKFYNQKKYEQNSFRGEYIDTRSILYNILDDIIPYINVLYANSIKSIKKNQNGDKNQVNFRISDLFQEELDKSISEIKQTSESIILFLRMWMGIINTDLNSFIVVSNNIILDMVVMKANLQEYLEIHRGQASQVYIVSSLNDFECQLFCKIPRINIIPQSNFIKQNNYNNLSSSQFEFQNSTSNFTNKEKNKQKQIMKMFQNFNEDQYMDIENTVDSEQIFDSVREKLYQIYQLDDNSELFFFDENYVQVNTVMEFEKTKLIKVLNNKQNHNQKFLNYNNQSNSAVCSQINGQPDQINKQNTVESSNLNQNNLLNHNMMDNDHFINKQTNNYNQTNDQHNNHIVEQTNQLNNSNKMIQQKPFIIGISGGTRSGKGTLCGHLQILYGAKYICQDSYFNYPLIQTTLQGNAECKEAILWDQFLSDIQKIIQQDEYKVIIIDGFQLFNHQTIIELCDIHIFLDVPDEEIYQRRMMTKPVKESYFWRYLMKEYSAYRQYCFQNQIINKLPSNKDQFDIYDLTLQLIKYKLYQTYNQKY